MKKHLEKIRQKPDHEKKHIVRTMAITVTGLIFLAYLLILAFVPKEEKPKETTQGSALSTFTDILNNGFDQLGDIGSQIKQKREEIEFSPENIELLTNEIQGELNVESGLSAENVSAEAEAEAEAELTNETQ